VVRLNGCVGHAAEAINVPVFDHVTIRVPDLEEARAFYGLAVGLLGFGEPTTDGHFFEWDDFSISTAREDRPVTRRLHIGFAASSRAAVDEWWKAMTAAGYPSDGEPGLRRAYSEEYYGAFVLDPAGNSIEACRHDWTNEQLGCVDHLWIRVRDVAASKRFYETIAPISRFELRHDSEERAGFKGAGASFSVLVGEPTEHVHVAFAAPDNGTVDEFHRIATEAGYRDNGVPGERRYHPGYYGAFVLDPDGNNVEAVCHNR
jgi:catechol 2,3-dioxygenase-like lactoylglutathione lyase family enzyme